MEIDGGRAQVYWYVGKPIAVVNAWDIATGRGWIEKAEAWARQHRALLYDTEGGLEDAVKAAFAPGVRTGSCSAVQRARLIPFRVAMFYNRARRIA